jgi:hypothetical protein
VTGGSISTTSGVVGATGVGVGVTGVGVGSTGFGGWTTGVGVGGATGGFEEIPGSGLSCDVALPRFFGVLFSFSEFADLPVKLTRKLGSVRYPAAVAINTAKSR